FPFPASMSFAMSSRAKPNPFQRLPAWSKTCFDNDRSFRPESCRVERPLEAQKAPPPPLIFADTSIRRGVSSQGPREFSIAASRILHRRTTNYIVDEVLNPPIRIMVFPCGH